MEMINLLLCIACAGEIFIQSLRIVWLYYTSFMKKSFIYNLKEPNKTEALLYYILFIIAMGYYIFISIEKVL
jgi:hypothetical protein